MPGLTTHHEVDRVVGPYFAGFYEPLGERGHHVLHEVVAERDRLVLQQLLLLSLHFRQADALRAEDEHSNDEGPHEMLKHRRLGPGGHGIV